MLLDLSTFKMKIICTYIQPFYLYLESNKITKEISNKKIKPPLCAKLFDFIPNDP